MSVVEQGHPQRGSIFARSPHATRRGDLPRRLLAEFVGSVFLAAVVVGSGIAAQLLSPGQIGLELLENATATGAGLFAIILMVGSVSGGHFNPVVSIVDAAFSGMTWRDALAYIPAQVAGCVGGAALANLMFGLNAFSISQHDRSSGAHWLAEGVATVGLLLVIFALARSGRPGSAPAAVGAYIGAAYFFTSSTSFANPAITVGRMFSNTFAGIAPGSAPGYIIAQLVGAAVAFGLISALYPDIRARAEDVVMPVTAVPEVLFVCVHNAGRSQMAAALLAHRARGSVHIRSAGSDPSDHLNEAVVEAMSELGLDISKEFPRPLTDEAVKAADVVITMGCGDACPLYPGKRYLDWELEDPAGKPLATVRRIRDEVDQRVQALLAELVPASAPRRPPSVSSVRDGPTKPGQGARP